MLRSLHFHKNPHKDKTLLLRGTGKGIKWLPECTVSVRYEHLVSDASELEYLVGKYGVVVCIVQAETPNHLELNWVSIIFLSLQLERLT